MRLNGGGFRQQDEGGRTQAGEARTDDVGCIPTSSMKRVKGVMCRGIDGK